MNEAHPAPPERLAAAFRAIHATRMRGLPFVNERLAVEAVGFREWNGRWLGVLITPWFMNLVLLPDDAPGARWRSLRPGASAAYAFPAGVFEFIGAHEEAVGEFQSCSLFSPMFEFADQATARLAAEAALAALFEAPDRARGAVTVSKRDFLLGRVCDREERR
ncbi:MAG: [NiFe]-hydrogenase assembly chaperone HybE [Burkholderiaceae bacterium]|nr:[NiFe]-hydrogenase assembly chaperone HybE [Burkholderiaceae bacterium]